MNLRILTLATLVACQAPEPKPLPTPKAAATPVGLCDSGELVRAVDEHLKQHPITKVEPGLNGQIAIGYVPCRDLNTDAQCKVYEAEAALEEARAAKAAQDKRDTDQIICSGHRERELLFDALNERPHAKVKR